jgi:hypothetical protein
VNLSYLYTINFEGQDILVASDEHYLIYAPSFLPSGVYSVIKQTKNEMELEIISGIHRNTPPFDKVIPQRKDLFQIAPYDIYGWGNSAYKIEFFLNYIYKLSQGKTAINMKHLSGFMESIRSDGKIQIFCPRRGPGHAWRVEHTDNWGNLRYGVVFMPLQGFEELEEVKSPYDTDSGFTEYEEASGESDE